MPFFTKKYISLYCDKCGKHEISDRYNVKNIRKDGWSVSKDYKKCYCPECTIKRKYPKNYKNILE